MSGPKQIETGKNVTASGRYPHASYWSGAAALAAATGLLFLLKGCPKHETIVVTEPAAQACGCIRADTTRSNDTLYVKLAKKQGCDSTKADYDKDCGCTEKKSAAPKKTTVRIRKEEPAPLPKAAAPVCPDCDASVLGSPGYQGAMRSVRTDIGEQVTPLKQSLTGNDGRKVFIRTDVMVEGRADGGYITSATLTPVCPGGCSQTTVSGILSTRLVGTKVGSPGEGITCKSTFNSEVK